MRNGILFSVVLHAGVVGLAIFGLPRSHEPLEIQNAMDVAFVLEDPGAPEPAPPQVATAAPAPAPPRPEPPQQQVQTPPPPPPPPLPPPPAPAPPAPTPAPPPPAPEAEPAPEEPEPQAEPEPKPPEPKPEPPKPEPKPEPPKPEPQQQAAAPRAPDRPEPPKKKPEPQQKAFDSVLKTVQNLNKAPAPKTEEKKKDDKPAAPQQTSLAEAVARAMQKKDTPVQGQKAPQALAGQSLTPSEFDAVRQAIRPCWFFNPGASGAQDFHVTIRAEMRPDGSVSRATRETDSRYGSDPFYTAFADSVLRAVTNERCQPYPLPPEKYDTWRVTNLRFSAREMIGQ